jgi:hypothetical protein
MPTIRAEIIGTTCTALGITAHGSAPVLALCRKLVEAGHDPATPLEAWRGAVLCLRIRSIGEGAQITVQDGENGRPGFRRWRDREKAVAQPRPFAEPAEGLPSYTLH